MTAYDIARIIRERLEDAGVPFRYTPETGTFACALGGQWAVILQPFGMNIEFTCWYRPGFSIMAAAKLAEFAERLNSCAEGKFSVRGHETEQGKLQLSCRVLKRCGNDFGGEVFGEMFTGVSAMLTAAGKGVTALMEGGLSPEEAAKVIG